MVGLEARLRDALCGNIARKVDHELRARGWNKMRLARESRLSSSTISGICQGKSCPSLATAVMLAHGLGIGLDELVGLRN